MVKWQCVILIVETRLECICGNLALFVFLDDNNENDKNDKNDMTYTAYCQECYVKEQNNNVSD